MHQGAQDYLVKGQVDSTNLTRAIRYAIERKIIHESLRESESRYRLLADHMTDTVWLMDMNLQTTYISPSVEKVRGYTLAEIQQLPLDKQLTPGSLQMAMEIFSQEMPRALADPTFPLKRTLELEFYHKDGTTFWSENTFSLIRDESGNPTAFLGEGRDITERKQAEEAVHRLNAELEQRVVERTAQLQAAVKEMETFSYSVSHDLRAPLRAMNGFSHILLDEYAAQLPTQAQHYLGTISDNAQQMGRLIDDLLAFSRLSRQPLSHKPFAMSDLVRAALATLSAEQAGRQVEIVIGDMPDCAADPALLKQVWVNLLSNALKFTRQHPLARIEVGHVEDAAGVQACYIRDNGVGFDMRYADKLFGVFQRLHSSEEYEGTGVGLAIVQHIVQRHGGRVWAEAEVDKGATFYFTLGDDAALPDKSE